MRNGLLSRLDQDGLRKTLLGFGEKAIIASVGVMFAPAFGAKLGIIFVVSAAIGGFTMGVVLCVIGLAKEKQ